NDGGFRPHPIRPGGLGTVMEHHKAELPAWLLENALIRLAVWQIPLRAFLYDAQSKQVTIKMHRARQLADRQFDMGEPCRSHRLLLAEDCLGHWSRTSPGVRRSLAGKRCGNHCGHTLPRPSVWYG